MGESIADPREALSMAVQIALKPSEGSQTGHTITTDDDQPDIPNGAANIRLLVIIGLLTTALCAPAIRMVHSFSTSDEGIFLHAADRMLRGDRLYADFFEFLPPGSFVITSLWLATFGTSLAAARMLAILTITGIAVFTYLACLRVSRNGQLSAFIAIGWVIASQGYPTVVSHHYLTTLFSMIAAWAMLICVTRPAASRWAAWLAGLAGGTAAMITPTRGALILLAMAINFLGLHGRNGKRISLILGTAVVPLLLVIYILQQGAFLEAAYDVIVFPVLHYQNVNRVPYGFTWARFTIPSLVLFPALLGMLGVRCLSGWRGAYRDRVLRSCAILALAGFLGSLTRPDTLHLTYVSPLACPLLAYLLATWLPRWRRAQRVAAVSLGIALIAPMSLIMYVAHVTTWGAATLDTPRGTVAAGNLPPGGANMLARIAATPPGDRFLFYPYLSVLPFLTDRQHVSKYDLFIPGYTTPLQYQETCIAALQQAQWLVIDRVWDDPQVFHDLFPSLTQPNPPERTRMEQALEQGFTFVAREGSLELRRRAVGVDEAVCAGIAH